MERVNNDSCTVDFPLGDDGILIVSSAFPHVDNWTIFLLGSVFFLVSTLIVRRKRAYSGATVHVTIQDTAKASRKQAFLSKYGDDYGYRRGSEKGYIDNWRHQEYPTLQPPLSSQESTQNCTNEEYEIYLDYAGSALPSRSQLEACFHSQSFQILANPHSSGPAASRTLLGTQKSKSRILKHFDAAAGRFASVHPGNDSSTMDKNNHSGFEIAFTSGTTEALRLVAERFPWQTQSVLLYAQNSHSSVLGMREVVIARGAKFVCMPMEEIQAMTKESFETLRDGIGNDTIYTAEKPNCLLVFPAECNFGGLKPDSRNIIATARFAGWNTMLDIAKAASTGSVSLRELNPDFSCVSFYKLFGSPTGVGSLFVKRTAIDLLSSGSQRHYTGGGSFNLILAKQDMSATSSNGLSSLVSGTPNFRGVLELEHGFEEIKKLGGMENIRRHTNSLAQELYDRLSTLRHGNGRPVVVTYGAWATRRKSKNSEHRGPTIAMNILRDDGSFVGYNEVAKLAALRKPAVQFRTGCFCNPGACQEALELTDKELIENYKVAGHVCGDHIDILNDKPTGAIRISFGKDSIWEDLDEFVDFIDQTFANKSMAATDEMTVTTGDQQGPSEVTVTELYIFPIKSCAAQRVSRWKIDLQKGKLEHDREFALVDSSGVAMRLQKNPKMGFITPRIDVDSETLTVSAPGCDDLVIPLGPMHSDFLGSNDISVCGNRCGGRLWGGRKASEWFSSYLGVECWLARYAETKIQIKHAAGAIGGQDNYTTTGFANDQPILMISENAVDALNDVLRQQNQSQVGSKHFRPNMVVRWKAKHSQYKAHLEDDWAKLHRKSNDLTFNVKGDCARCAMVDYDPSTGKKGKTLRALANYRRRNGQIVFGVFLKAEAGKKLHVENKVAWINEADQLQYE